MIYIKNTQRKYKLDIENIRTDIEKILHCIGYEGFDVSVWFMSKDLIRQYNRQYREKDKTTDVISFPYHADIIAEGRIIPKHEDDYNLGDILVCPEYIDEHKDQWNQTLEERIRALLVHSICHLIGYDHITDKEYAQMDREEKRILKRLESA